MSYFKFREFIKSDTASAKHINNMPANITTIENLDALRENILEPLRKAYGKPIFISSGYRCSTLNKAVGGVSNSQHMTGQAVDLRIVSNGKVLYDENAKLFNLAKSLNLPFDQLLNEKPVNGKPSWVHISYKADGSNRHQVITIK